MRGLPVRRCWHSADGVALDVIDGGELQLRDAHSLSNVLNSAVPGIWIWEQSPTSLLASYASIRGASSFGLSYPKVYIDGIEVANSLLVSRRSMSSQWNMWSSSGDHRVRHCNAPTPSAAWSTS